jgi:hypothetical protein
MALAGEPLAYANSTTGAPASSRWTACRDRRAHYDKLIPVDAARVESDLLGVLPGSNTAWVSQEHELGRISFYSPPSTIQTLTGLELNSAIETERSRRLVRHPVRTLPLLCAMSQMPTPTRASALYCAGVSLK